MNCEIEESFERQSVTYSITKLEGNGSPLPKINAAHHDGWTSHSAVLSNLTNDEAGCYVCKVTNFDNQVIASERACLFVEEGNSHAYYEYRILIPRIASNFYDVIVSGILRISIIEP